MWLVVVWTSTFLAVLHAAYLSITPKGDDGIWKDYAYVLSTDVIDFS